MTASVSTFSPKPHTPFQWARAALRRGDAGAPERCCAASSAAAASSSSWHDAGYRGSRASSRAAIAGSPTSSRRRSASARASTAGRTAAASTSGSRRSTKHGLDAAFYLRRRSLGETLPWEHLDAGVSDRFLHQDLARAVEGRLTPDCSIERCTYCGACDFRDVRNVDYHPEGAKGTDHRGAAISRWAEMVVPSEDATLPEWETRAWRRIRTDVAARRAAREPSPPAPRRSTRRRFRRRSAPTPRPALVTGEGNAEEWLGAVPSSLAPVAGCRAAPVQRIRLRYRKVGPARFIGIARARQRVRPRRSPRPPADGVLARPSPACPRIAFGPAPAGRRLERRRALRHRAHRGAAPPPRCGATLAAELPDGLTLLGVVRDSARRAQHRASDRRASAGEVDLRRSGRPSCRRADRRSRAVPARASRSPSASQASAASASSTRGRRS